MKIFSQILVFAAVPALLLVSSGTKPGAIDPPKKMAPLIIRFDNVVGNDDLELNSKEYVNSSQEHFTVSQLQYFVSNIKLRREDGKLQVVNQPENYFLIQENVAVTQTIQLNVPAGDYNQLSFVLGVDSLRNTMNISQRTGVLDPASSMDNGMYWTWNSGYIFFKMEGESKAAATDPTGNRRFRFHIGGFGGYSAPTINNIKTITLDLKPAGVVKAKKGRKPVIVLQADVLKVFNATTPVSIATHPSVMFSDYSVNIANNYSMMFKHTRTEN